MSLKRLLREYGHDVYIQRILPNGNYFNEFEKVTTRYVGKSAMRMIRDQLDEYVEGVNINYDATYYFETNVNPKEGDRIYENYSMKTNSNYTSYIVQGATAVRGRLGKIQYWITGCRRE